VAGGCPSPHPAGNLGGALGVSESAAAPAGWSELAHRAAGRRRELGREGEWAPAPPGRGHSAPGAAGYPGSQATPLPPKPSPGPQAAVPKEAAAIPLDSFGDLCLRTGAGGRRGRGECLAVHRGEVAAGAARRLELLCAQRQCQHSLPAPPMAAEGCRAPTRASNCKEAYTSLGSQPLGL
jgi:hypothetical protein